MNRGFSTNKDIQGKTKLGKETLKAFSIVYNGLVNALKDSDVAK